MLPLLLVLDIVALVGVGGFLLALPVMLILPGFFFDSPRANFNISLVMALSWWLFPVTAGLGGVMGVLSFKHKQQRAMIYWSLLAWASPIAFVLALTVGEALR